MSWGVNRAARVFAKLAEELDRLAASLKSEFAEEDIKLIRWLKDVGRHRRAKPPLADQMHQGS